jgi:hypothetical protein
LDIRLQFGDDLRIVILTDGAFGVGVRERDEDVPARRTPRRNRKTRRQHADDRIGFAVERQRPADGFPATQSALPETIANDGDTATPRRILIGQKDAPVCRIHANDLEEAGADGGRNQRFRIAKAGERELAETVNRHALEELRIALPVVVVRGRHRERRHIRKRTLRRNVKQAHEAIGLLVGQRPEQDGVHDAENRGIGTDAQREDGNDRQRE